jgi:glycosyltransferase involved in cell wall biosynthesis
MQGTKKILLLTPAASTKGGIVNYFQVLESKFNLPVEYFVRGARNWPNRDVKIKEIIRAWKDLQAFRRRINKGDILLVQSSTSLGLFAVIRDGFFLKSAQIKNITSIAFFRGWDENFEKKLIGWRLFLFKRFYFNSNAFIVLSKKFEKKLREWGFQGDIFLETTIVDDELLIGFDKRQIKRRIEELGNTSIRLLFLARTEKEKGLFETIKAFIKLKKKYPQLHLTIAGNGSSRDEAIKMIKDANMIDSVDFPGFVRNQEKKNLYVQSHIYLFPSYSEGMPNSILEAMAFGLPIITTPVGGITDFFENEKHGFYIEIKNVDQIVEKVNGLIHDLILYMKISNENFNYSRSRFLTQVVIKRLEIIYSNYITKNY